MKKNWFENWNLLHYSELCSVLHSQLISSKYIASTALRISYLFHLLNLFILSYYFTSSKKKKKTKLFQKIETNVPHSLKPGLKYINSLKKYPKLPYIPGSISVYLINFHFPFKCNGKLVMEFSLSIKTVSGVCRNVFQFQKWSQYSNFIFIQIKYGS